MKKFISLLLAALILAIPSALATETMTVFAGETYTIGVPSTWTIGEDSDLNAYMPDGASNFIIATAENNVHISAKEIEEMGVDTMMQSYVDQYGDVTRVDPPTPVTAGSHEFALLAFNITYSGLQLYMEQYFTCVDTTMYIFTVTYLDTAEIENVHAMLSTFAVNGEEAQAVQTQPVSDEPIYTLYTDASGYSLTYPDTWYPADENTLAFAQGLMNNNSFEGMDMDALRQSVAAAKESNMFMIYASDFASNMNVIAQSMGMAADADTLSTLIPTLINQYKGMLGDTVRQTNEGNTVVTYGGNTYAWVGLYYELNGAPMQLEQYMICPTDTLYIITYTTQNGNETYRADVEDILASFAAP